MNCPLATVRYELVPEVEEAVLAGPLVVRSVPPRLVITNDRPIPVGPDVVFGPGLFSWAWKRLSESCGDALGGLGFHARAHRLLDKLWASHLKVATAPVTLTVRAGYSFASRGGAAMPLLSPRSPLAVPPGLVCGECGAAVIDGVFTLHPRCDVWMGDVNGRSEWWRLPACSEECYKHIRAAASEDRECLAKAHRKLAERPPEPLPAARPPEPPSAARRRPRQRS